MSETRRITGRGQGIYLSFVIPGVILYTLLVVFPIFVGFFFSITNWNGVSQTYKIVGLQNYLAMFQDRRMVNAVLFTLRYTVMFTVSIMVLSLSLALLLNMKIRAQTAFRTIMFFPAVLSLVVIGLMWNEIFYRLGPMIGEALNIEVLKTNILASGKLAQFGVLLVNVWQGLAIPTTLFIAGLQVIPNELYEAATLDGALVWQKFKSITVPFLMPVINVVLVLTMKAGLTIFDIIRGMTDGGPGRATESISLLIYRNAFTENRYSFGVAQSVVLFIVIALISFAQFSILGKNEVGER